MKPVLTALFILAALPVQAACFADYKAKRDDPLRLHYGVAQINGACTKAAAKSELAPRLARDGWTLLTILSTFDDIKLDSKKASAGAFFLRY